MPNREESNYKKYVPPPPVPVRCIKCSATRVQLFRVPAKEKGKHKQFKQEPAREYICINCK